jgi:hypothetical protein
VAPRWCGRCGGGVGRAWRVGAPPPPLIKIGPGNFMVWTELGCRGPVLFSISFSFSTNPVWDRFKEKMVIRRCIDNSC